MDALAEFDIEKSDRSALLLHIVGFGTLEDNGSAQATKRMFLSPYSALGTWVRHPADP